MWLRVPKRHLALWASTHLAHSHFAPYALSSSPHSHAGGPQLHRTTITNHTRERL